MVQLACRLGGSHCLESTPMARLALLDHVSISMTCNVNAATASHQMYMGLCCSASAHCVCSQGSWLAAVQKCSWGGMYLEQQQGDDNFPAGKVPGLGDVHQGRCRCQGAYAVRKYQALEGPCKQHAPLVGFQAPPAWMFPKHQDSL